MNIIKYLSNCFLLLIPIFLWNIILAGDLPKSYSSEIFWHGIPKFIGYSENILRFIVFIFPVIMTLSLKTRLQKVGFFIYLIGVILYFISWIMVITLPESDWSQSLIGFMAPAYTTIIWFVGIGLIGNKSFFKFPYLSLVYICFSILFVIFHCLHVYIVFQKM